MRLAPSPELRPQPQKPRAEQPNQVWSLDFVADQLSDGWRFRALTVVDVYTRECLAVWHLSFDHQRESRKSHTFHDGHPGSQLMPDI